MSYYALVASLPALKIGQPSSLSLEAYIDSCTSWLSEQELATLKSVVQNEEKRSTNPLAKRWFDAETQLRNAVVQLRGQKLGVDAKSFLQPHEGFSGTIESKVTEAMSKSNPVEMEQGLDHLRWQLAEELIGDDPFGFSKILAYGIQLSLVERWSQMDDEKGAEALETIIVANTEKETQTEESV